MTEREGPAGVVGPTAGGEPESRRVTEARSRARRRLSRQRSALQPLGWAVIAAVAIGAVGGDPRPGLQGRSIGVALALCAFAAALALAIRDRFTERRHGAQTAVISVMGAAGVALAALQPRGATELAGGAAVWMAFARLPLPMGVAVGASVTIALDLAAGLAGGSAAVVLAITLLCALLAVVAYFVQQARQSQDHAELLLAQLEDAREEQMEAAAFAERSRIATELHDVLAHSLSGAAIQLQGARVLAEREQADPQVRTAIDRAGALVKDGLVSARQAVGALRGDQLPGVAQLPSLVATVRDDWHVDLTLSVEGNVRSLPTDASLALYRGAQEALTNVARYARGASTSVVLRYEEGRTSLSVEDRRATHDTTPRGDVDLNDVGGGRGLAGMRERVERLGGSVRAGPTDEGWRVVLEVPA